MKFIDESSCQLGMTRPYGWAKKGERCWFTTPGNTGVRRSIVGLFTLDAGMEAHRSQRGSLKAVDFETFVRESVVPCLVAGDVVIVDNASCHKSKVARELVESAGARLLFLPAYSPDYSPIELAWRKVKAGLREVHACTGEALEEAIEAAMQLVMGEDARRFYHHCGYQKAGQVEQDQ